MTEKNEHVSNVCFYSDGIDEYLSQLEKDESTYPMNGLPKVSDWSFTDEEKKFLSQSSVHSLRDR